MDAGAGASAGTGAKRHAAEQPDEALAKWFTSEITDAASMAAQGVIVKEAKTKLFSRLLSTLMFVPGYQATPPPDLSAAKCFVQTFFNIATNMDPASEFQVQLYSGGVLGVVALRYLVGGQTLGDDVNLLLAVARATVAPDVCVAFDSADKMLTVGTESFGPALHPNESLDEVFLKAFPTPLDAIAVAADLRKLLTSNASERLLVNRDWECDPKKARTRDFERKMKAGFAIAFKHSDTRNFLVNLMATEQSRHKKQRIAPAAPAAPAAPTAP